MDWCKVKVMCKLQSLLLIIALIPFQLANTGPAAVRVSVNSFGNSNTETEPMPVTSKPSEESKLIDNATTTSAKRIRGLKQKKDIAKTTKGLIPDAAKDDFAEKDGKTDQAGYLRNFHKNGKGGYDHYEAYHNKDSAVYEHEDLTSIGKDEDDSASGHKEEVEEFVEQKSDDDDASDDEEGDDDNGNEEKSIDENMEATKERNVKIKSGKKNAAGKLALSPRKLHHPQSKRNNPIETKSVNDIKGKTPTSGNPGSNLPHLKNLSVPYKTCKRKRKKNISRQHNVRIKPESLAKLYDSTQNSRDNNTSDVSHKPVEIHMVEVSKSNEEDDKSTDSDHRDDGKSNEHTVNEDETMETEHKKDSLENPMGYEVYEDPDEGNRRFNHNTEHLEPNLPHYEKFESNNDYQDPFQHKTFEYPYTKSYQPQQDNSHESHSKIHNEYFNYRQRPQLANVRHRFGGYEAFIVHGSNEDSTPESDHRDQNRPKYYDNGNKGPNERSSVINYHYPTLGINHNEKSGKEKNYGQSSDYGHHQDSKVNTYQRREKKPKQKTEPESQSVSKSDAESRNKENTKSNNRISSTNGRIRATTTTPTTVEYRDTQDENGDEEEEDDDEDEDKNEDDSALSSKAEDNDGTKNAATVYESDENGVDGSKNKMSRNRTENGNSDGYAKRGSQKQKSFNYGDNSDGSNEETVDYSKYDGHANKNNSLPLSQLHNTNTSNNSTLSSQRDYQEYYNDDNSSENNSGNVNDNYYNDEDTARDTKDEVQPLISQDTTSEGEEESDESESDQPVKEYKNYDTEEDDASPENGGNYNNVKANVEKEYREEHDGVESSSGDEIEDGNNDKNGSNKDKNQSTIQAEKNESNSDDDDSKDYDDISRLYEYIDKPKKSKE